LAQLAVEVLPKTLKFGEQRVEHGIGGLAQPGNASNSHFGDYTLRTHPTRISKRGRGDHGKLGRRLPLTVNRQRGNRRNPTDARSWLFESPHSMPHSQTADFWAQHDRRASATPSSNPFRCGKLIPFSASVADG
jgi:hypothetical protein